METQSPRESAKASFADVLKHRKDIVDKVKNLEKERGNVNYTSRFEEVEKVLAQMRLACIQTIFHDFEYADFRKVENMLWVAHTYLNTEYRNIVGRLVAQNQVVQKRKLEKLYRDFLKTSQSFYRAYIQRLSGRFYIPELRRAAEGLELELTETPLRDVPIPLQLREMLVKSCHSSLNHLGDLARYRCQASEKISKSAFDTALAYYCVANMVDPDDGAAHHQMAVLYRLGSQHLDIVYHFHRSISIDKPHQLGLENLEKEFRTIRNSQNARRLSPKDPSEALVLWFVRLHAFYFEGEPFSQQRELEEEVLHRLELALKAEGFFDILVKIVLINIAAYSVAKNKVAVDWTANASRHCQFVLRFTVRTVSVLLRVLQASLQDDHGHPVDVAAGSGESPLAFGPALTKLLPLLRIYIAWMYSLRADLVEFRMYLEFHITETYKTLSDTLTLLGTLIAPTASTIQSQYLLKEDMEVMGLKPLNDEGLPLLLQTELVTGTDPPKRQRTRKPYRQVGGRQFKPHTEAVWRIRDILCCGALLASSPNFPLSLVSQIQNGREMEIWTYVDETTSPKLVDGTGMDHLLSKLNLGDSKPIFEADPLPQPASTRVAPGSTDFIEHSPLGALDGAPPEHLQMGKGKCVEERVRGPVGEPDLSEDSEMVEMVNKLLDPTEESRPGSSRAQAETTYGMNSTTANEIFGQLASSPAQPSPLAKSIPSLPWDYFYSPTPHRPTSRGQDLSTTDDFYKPRTTVAAFEGLGSPHMKQSHSRHSSRHNLSRNEVYPRTPVLGATTPGMTKVSHVSSEDGFPKFDAVDPAARKAAHENLASALYAQFGMARSNGQNTSQVSSPVIGNLPRQEMPVSGSMINSSPGGVRSSSAYLERSGSQLVDSAAGFTGGKTIDPQPSSDAFSQRTSQFQNFASPSSNAFSFRQPSAGIWGGPTPTDAGSNQNYTSWLAQESAAARSSLAFSHPSSLYMGTPGAGHNPVAAQHLAACNSNLYDAHTAFGHDPGYNHREGPAHYRKQLRETSGEVDDSYDRQILAAAMMDDKGQPLRDAK